jgi:flagellar biosynthesis protein FlhF
MNIQRFIAPTAREALAKARLAFGEGTLILSNRPTATGVEVVATAEDTLTGMESAKPMPTAMPAPAPVSKPVAAVTKGITMPRRAMPPGATTAAVAHEGSKVEEDAAQLAMSTLSFQDYVRERMLKRRHEASQSQAAELVEWEKPRNQATPAAQPAVASAPTKSALPTVVPQGNKLPAVRPSPSAISISPSPTALTQGVVDELQAMKDLIEDRFNTLTWLGQARQHPIQSNLMLKLIRAGYSPALSRTILEKMPERMGAAESFHWVTDVLERNLKTDAGSLPLHQAGGTFAMVGATGVGKTTTIAKLAGLCAREHGAASVGLITLDTYRVGAHEQLRAYGRMLGVVAHLAHDRAALQDLLGLLSGKKLILIDTTGLAPRDPRKRDMIDILELPGVNQLLVLNAGSHGDTLDDMVSSFKPTGIAQAVLSKTDEAVKLGPALDAAIRHKLVLRGITTGQKVPEDWESADASKLIRMSMGSAGRSAYNPIAADLGFFFTPSDAHAGHQGRAHV